MSDEIKLKPCPFCGSDDLSMNGDSQYVFCRGCGAEGAWNDDSVEEAIAAWNQRAPVAPPSDSVYVPQNEEQARMMLAVAINYLGLDKAP